MSLVVWGLVDTCGTCTGNGPTGFRSTGNRVLAHKHVSEATWAQFRCIFKLRMEEQAKVKPGSLSETYKMIHNAQKRTRRKKRQEVIGQKAQTDAND